MFALRFKVTLVLLCYCKFKNKHKMLSNVNFMTRYLDRKTPDMPRRLLRSLSKRWFVHLETLSQVSLCPYNLSTISYSLHALVTLRCNSHNLPNVKICCGVNDHSTSGELLSNWDPVHY